METYEPIGLDTLLEGICECLEPGEEKSPGTPPPPDPVEEFIERMHEAFPPPFVAPVVPGIGPFVPDDHVTAVCLWLTDCARRQSGLVGPRNIRHFLCPSLEERSMYEEAEKTMFKCV
ncbi:uncharacterized protein LOC125499720 [Athalia rosae]|uniref:uncharacterized protein LOC125499720 n=1 Tax=Athalia rosae TaxID=37344 RepID=UPI0020340A7D|nr:uncharacterized protein LOC125499720 [Athalia rosae]